jgi:cystathionine beta-lyase family protein involved in aluminum resistance
MKPTIYFLKKEEVERMDSWEYIKKRDEMMGKLHESYNMLMKVVGIESETAKIIDSYKKQITRIDLMRDKGQITTEEAYQMLKELEEKILEEIPEFWN